MSTSIGTSHETTNARTEIEESDVEVVRTGIQKVSKNETSTIETINAKNEEDIDEENIEEVTIECSYHFHNVNAEVITEALVFRDPYEVVQTQFKQKEYLNQ